MDTSTKNISSRRSSMNQHQLLQDLTIELESAQNELAIIQLEKLEYEKELKELKEQNEELTKENDEFYETAEIEQQEIIYLRHVSMNIDQENNDLQSQNYRYQQIIKQLRSENESLQKENEKYKSIFEQLFEQNQKKDEIHTNNISHLENKLKQLQHENDQLRQEMDTITTNVDDIDIDIDITKLSIPFQSPTSIINEPHSDSDDAQKRKYSLTIKDTENFDEFQLGTEMDIDTTLIMNDNDDIISQLLQFGYEEHEVLEAMKMVTNKDDINEIIEYLENNIQRIDYLHCNLMEEEVKQKQQQIESLQKQNKESKAKIHRLQSKIKELRAKNQRLILKLNIKEETKKNSCMFHFRLW